MQATYSALIMVCINNEQLERAGEVYQLTVKSGLHPDIHAYNALINAYGCDFQVCSAWLICFKSKTVICQDSATAYNQIVPGSMRAVSSLSLGLCAVLSLSPDMTPFSICCCVKHSLCVAS